MKGLDPLSIFIAASVSLLERFAPLFVLETINTKKEYVGKSNI